jgi:hypothetical protein
LAAQVLGMHKKAGIDQTEKRLVEPVDFRAEKGQY